MTSKDTSDINQKAKANFNSTQEKLLGFWRILGIDYQDFLENPTDTHLVTLNNHCQAYLNEVLRGHLVLPRVSHKQPKQYDSY